MKLSTHPTYEVRRLPRQVGRGHVPVPAPSRRPLRTGLPTLEWEPDGATYQVVDVDVSSASHPFWTGTARVLDSEGRVDKFCCRYQPRLSAPPVATHRSAGLRSGSRSGPRPAARRPLGEDAASAAGALGRVHRGVGPGGAAVVGVCRPARRRSGPTLALIVAGPAESRNGERSATSDSLGSVSSATPGKRSGRTRANSSPPSRGGENPGPGRGCAAGPRDLAEQLVTRRVPERVVHGLEPVEVDEEDGDRRLARTTACSSRLGEGPPVGSPVSGSTRASRSASAASREADDAAEASEPSDARAASSNCSDPPGCSRRGEDPARRDPRQRSSYPTSPPPGAWLRTRRPLDSSARNGSPARPPGRPRGPTRAADGGLEQLTLLATALVGGRHAHAATTTAIPGTRISEAIHAA